MSARRGIANIPYPTRKAPRDVEQRWIYTMKGSGQSMGNFPGKRAVSASGGIGTPGMAEKLLARKNPLRTEREKPSAIRAARRTMEPRDRFSYRPRQQ